MDVMVKEVDDEAKLAKIGREVGSSSSQSRGNFNRCNGGCMVTAIKTRTTAVLTKMVVSTTEEKAERTTMDLLSSSSRPRVPITGMLILFPFSRPRFFQLCPPLVRSNVGGRLKQFCNRVAFLFWLSMNLIYSHAWLCYWICRSPCPAFNSIWLYYV